MKPAVPLARAHVRSPTWELEAEMWLTHRLGNFGHVFEGVTDRELRKRRIREAIIEGKLDVAIAGKGANGKAETFAQVFERLYHERLVRP